MDIKTILAKLDGVRRVETEVTEEPDNMQTPHDAPVKCYDGVTRTVQEWREFLGEDAPGQILHRFGQWIITDYGVEALGDPYWIEWDRVEEPDWVEHLCAKNWVHRPDVEAVFAQARTMRGHRR